MLTTEKQALIGITEDNIEVCLIPSMANRHGLITGATGTGKTVSLQTLAETFSQLGTSVFVADVKGDLSGLALEGGNQPSVIKRVEKFGLIDKGFSYQSFPVQFWDVFGEQGIPVRTTINEMGALLLSHLFSLNEIQSNILSIAFTIAKKENLELIDIKDLQKLLEHITQNASAYSASYGSLPPASLGAIQRSLTALAHNTAEIFFAEPSLSIHDLIREENGKGIINILAAEKLMLSPATYTTFLLWLMDKLFTSLPEVGDVEKPKLVFFFDEAHLLFKNAPKALLDRVEQVVRLIRSKGVGIYFISQTPSDIPDAILGQLGNRVQHALRAYTPKDQKALKAAAQTFRANPAFTTETVISALETGEALISFLDKKGAPLPVEKAFIISPQSHLGTLNQDKREEIIKKSPLQEVYSTPQNRVTAFEILTDREKPGETNADIAFAKNTNNRSEASLEKERVKQEKIDNKAALQRVKLWESIVKSVIIPFIKQLMNSFFKRK